MQLWTGYQSFVGNRTFRRRLYHVPRHDRRSRRISTGDGLSFWTNVPLTKGVSSNMAYLNKRTYGHTFEPTMEWKHDNIDINGGLSFSSSINNYVGGELRPMAGQCMELGIVIPVTGMTVSAEAHPKAQETAATTPTISPGRSNAEQRTGLGGMSRTSRRERPPIRRAVLGTTAATTRTWSTRRCSMRSPHRLSAWPTWFQMRPKVTESTCVLPKCRRLEALQLRRSRAADRAAARGFSNRPSSLTRATALRRVLDTGANAGGAEPPTRSGICSSRTPRTSSRRERPGVLKPRSSTNPRWCPGAGRRRLLDV